ncbi:MAG: hypothetical protein HQM02_04085 [Magnetococcales bacterium]|nr:hypothetical protein [Magnetococcales bacterium]
MIAPTPDGGWHRLLPLMTLFSLFPRLVRDLARQQDKRIALHLEGGATTADKRIIEEMKGPLTHLVRNAVDHGLETPGERVAFGKPEECTIRMRAMRTATHVVIEVADDGRGLDLDAIKRNALKRRLYGEGELALMTDAQVSALIFHSGFSTSAMVTDVSGRGVGLDVVRVNVERLKGSVQVVSEPGKGCCFTIRLPITLATTPVFIVAVGEHRFAVPLDFVHSVRRVGPQNLFHIEGRDAMSIDSAPVSVAHLVDLLELPLAPRDRQPPPLALHRSGHRRGTGRAAGGGAGGRTGGGDETPWGDSGAGAQHRRSHDPGVRGGLHGPQSPRSAQDGTTSEPLPSRAGHRPGRERQGDHGQKNHPVGRGFHHHPHPGETDPGRGGLRGGVGRGWSRRHQQTGPALLRRPGIRCPDAQSGRLGADGENPAESGLSGSPGDPDHLPLHRGGSASRSGGGCQRLSHQAHL